MKAIPDSCLAHYEQMPQTKLIDLSGISGYMVGQNIKEFRASTTAMPHPDKEAVQFYLFNHLAAEVRARFTRHEQLPPWAAAVMAEYKSILLQQGIRMTAYMCLITARESRHLGNKADSWWESNIDKQFGQEQGKLIRDFHNEVKGTSSSYAADAFTTSIPGTLTFGNIIGGFTVQFYKGSFSGGFGGKPWGNIAETLWKFVKGETTQEMMIDTAYTLAHNNGPMFNKGMLYSNYSGEFLRILDIQRSGQMPEFQIETNHGHLTTHQSVVFKAACEALPKDTFGTYVDYYRVEELGGITNLKPYQHAQDKKFGKKPAKPVSTVFNGKPAKEVGTFAVVPGVNVKVIERASA